MIQQFKQIIDTYISNYDTYNEEKITFECDYGELIFFTSKEKMLILYGIYIEPQYRQQGLCREILCYLIDKLDKTQFNSICIQSVLSKILYNYLLRFTYNNKKFIIYDNNFIYSL
jgi:N-acetylglutamate synthase-like GNAT family acetyltransferase